MKKLIFGTSAVVFCRARYVPNRGAVLHPFIQRGLMSSVFWGNLSFPLTIRLRTTLIRKPYRSLLKWITLRCRRK
jgi:hypothetical protein